MDIRIAWMVVLGCAVLAPAGCSRGSVGGFPGFGGGPSAQGDDDDDDEGEGDDETSNDGDVSTSGPADTTGPATSSDPSGLPPDDGPVDPPTEGDCCDGHGGMGCADAMVEACVCAQDPFCCSMEWDDLCASLTTELGCAPCDGPPPGDTGSMSETSAGEESGEPPPATSTTTTTGAGEETGSTGFGDCCEADGSAGCDDAAIESCVCAQDSYCCDNDWDTLCVDEVEEFGCGSCGGAESSGGESTGGGSTSTGGDVGVGDCCETHAAGCSASAIETCVCSSDAYCCDTAWDSLCVSEVDEFGCGMCP